MMRPPDTATNDREEWREGLFAKVLPWSPYGRAGKHRRAGRRRLGLWPQRGAPIVCADFIEQRSVSVSSSYHRYGLISSAPARDFGRASTMLRMFVRSERSPRGQSSSFLEATTSGCDCRTFDEGFRAGATVGQDPSTLADFLNRRVTSRHEAATRLC